MRSCTHACSPWMVPCECPYRPPCPGRRLREYSVQVLGTTPPGGRTGPDVIQIFMPVDGARLQAGHDYLALVWPDGHTTDELVLPVVSGLVMSPKAGELSGLPVAEALKLLGTWSQEPWQPSPMPGFNVEWGAILPADYFPTNMYAWCSRDAPAELDTGLLNAETIRRLETAIAPALQAALDKEIKDPAWRRAAKDYYRHVHRDSRPRPAGGLRQRVSQEPPRTERPDEARTGGRLADARRQCVRRRNRITSAPNTIRSRIRSGTFASTGPAESVIPREPVVTRITQWHVWRDPRFEIQLASPLSLPCSA